MKKVIKLKRRTKIMSMIFVLSTLTNFVIAQDVNFRQIKAKTRYLLFNDFKQSNKDEIQKVLDLTQKQLDLAPDATQQAIKDKQQADINIQQQTLNKTPQDTLSLGTVINLNNLTANGVNLIPLPTFNYICGNGNFGISVFGNNITTDSNNITKLSYKALIPQSSLIGFKISHYRIFSKADPSDSANFSIGFISEANILWKKFSSYDSLSKLTTKSTPVFFQTKLGLTGYNLSGFGLAACVSSISILSDNDNFEQQFSTKFKTIIYPEINLSFVYKIGSNKNIKANITGIGNTSDLRELTHTNDSFLFFLNLGFDVDL